ncbi:uncharacterized protein LOC125837700 [Solanum verrucosum]|uniref:uncharacterized protein LOC125837700 n=1 Tax=Solanum verrucosum TaxID=315347 RepID=UPI0020D1ABF2|nr:uncharacterized protein LOC125837700 [Solanum verrucosum]
MFMKAFLDRFFPRELRKAKVEEFINLKQAIMSVKEYSLKLTLLSKYAPSIVASPRDMMSRYLAGVSKVVANENRTAILRDDMDILCLMVYAQQMEEDKLEEEKSREKKRSRVDNDKSFHDGSDGHGRSRNRQKCGKRHEGGCLADREGCFSCGESGHKMKDCPKAKATRRDGKQVVSIGIDPETQKQNRFYDLQSREDQE